MDHIDDFDTPKLTTKDDDTSRTPIINIPENQVSSVYQGANIPNNKRKTPQNDILATKRARPQIASASGVGQKSLLKETSEKRMMGTIKKGLLQPGMVQNAIGLKSTSSPVSASGSGKSFYSKDDLFVDEVPSKLFNENDSVRKSEMINLKVFQFYY